MYERSVSERDWKLIDFAEKDVWHDSDDDSWTQNNLPLPLLTAWAIIKSQGVIDNGGFQYFFEANWPNGVPYSVFIRAFERIGAKETALLIAEVADSFPHPEPHLDWQMRNNWMDASPRNSDGDSIITIKGDRAIDLSDESFTLLANYIRSNISFFPNAEKSESE